nr:L-arabinose isomerase [Herpetosiphonaceae bacterium]
MIELNHFEVWFVTGSQHLYGPEVLEQVAEHSRIVAQALSDAAAIPVQVRFTPVLKTSDEIYQLVLEA